MPANSIRDDVLDNLKAALTGITAGADYHTTTTAVFGWRTPGPQSGAGWPAHSVLDLAEAVTVKQGTGTLQERRLTVLIQSLGMVADGADPDGYARNLLADVQKAIMVDPTRGGKAHTTSEGANRLMVDTPAAPFVVVELDVEITYRTRRGDPASVAP